MAAFWQSWMLAIATAIAFHHGNGFTLQSNIPETNVKKTAEGPSKLASKPADEFMTLETYFATPLNSSRADFLFPSLNSIEFCNDCQIHSIEGGILKVKTLTKLQNVAFIRTNCKVSLNEITGIISLLEDAIARTHSKEAPISTSSNSESTNMCRQAVQTIVTLSGQIGQLLDKMRAPGITQETFLEVKRNYELKIEDVVREIEFVKAHAEENAANKALEAGRKIEELQQQANSTASLIVHDIEGVVGSADPLFLGLVEVKLRKGEIAEAHKFYEKLRNKNLLFEIIEKEKTYRYVDFWRNLFIFLAKLAPEYQVKGLGIVADKFKTKNNDMGVLVVYQFLRELSILNLSPNDAGEVKKSMSLLEPMVKEHILNFLRQILYHGSRLHNVTVWDLARREPGILRSYFGDIVGIIYENCPNSSSSHIHRIMHTELNHNFFSDDLNADDAVIVEDKLRSFCERTKSMQPNQIICRFSSIPQSTRAEIFEGDACKLSAKLWLANAIHQEEESVPTQNPILPQLPELYKLILSGQKVVIQNPDQSYPFGLKTLFKDDRYRSYIDYYREDIAEVPGVPGDCWNFKVNDDGKLQIFREFSSDYMYVSEAVTASNQRRVQLWKHVVGKQSQGLWQVEDKKWRNNQVILRNVHYSWHLRHGEPTCHDGSCYEKRAVAVKQDEPLNMDNTDVWEIKKCTHRW